MVLRTMVYFGSISSKQVLSCRPYTPKWVLFVYFDTWKFFGHVFGYIMGMLSKLGSPFGSLL